ncbi:hypothetical protein Dsin_001003 [Dipteronia sinensis]|uniref:Myb/SANT-like domain-containing protein n=1 Tax=Dipteronia sinensis TaxID=43782 RepID=A0AAE0B4A7_9ROSI|nr:hypothetical protein Dsin_001003 [Dipteronia sinensis]
MKKQLKNGWDYMKKQYQVCIRLISTTRHGYNAMTNTIDWPAERWEEYLKTYPEAKQFRQKPLANFEELESLFSGVSATWAHNWSSGMQGIPEMGNTLTDFASSMYGGSYVRLLEEYDNTQTPNSDVNFEEHPIQTEEQPIKQKKRKVDGNC